MKICACYLLLCLASAGCGDEQTEEIGPVKVRFAQPFPTDAPDLNGFLPRDQKHYGLANDTATLWVENQGIVVKRTTVTKVAGHILDSLGLARQPGSQLTTPGYSFAVQAAVADSFLLRAQVPDTLLSLLSSNQHFHKLRYYGGWYYLSTPASDDSTKWEVERLAVVGNRFTWQYFNPDSLRLRALDPATLHLRRASGVLFFTVSPLPGRATKQVNDYAGLWLPRQELTLAGRPQGAAPHRQHK